MLWPVHKNIVKMRKIAKINKILHLGPMRPNLTRLKNVKYVHNEPLNNVLSLISSQDFILFKIVANDILYYCHCHCQYCCYIIIVVVIVVKL